MEGSANQATVLLLNLTSAALGGIDLLSFTTDGTTKFRGIKYLPTGWHFLFASATYSSSIRHGSWFRVKGSDDQPELVIKKWDKKNEVLVDETDEATKLRWRADLGSIWEAGLSPYRQSAGKDAEDEDKEYSWLKMTDAIEEPMLNRILGPTPNNWNLTSASSACQDLDRIPGLSNAETGSMAEKNLNFLPIDLKQTWREGAVGRERTEAAQDRTWALNELVKEHCRGDYMEVIGELQITFVAVLTLNNYSSLEQWKRILGLLFTCITAVTEHPDLFISLIQTLKLQLERCQDVDGGLFDLNDDGARLLKGLIRRFKRGLDQISGQAKVDVAEELEHLEEYLTAKHGWYFDDSFVHNGMLQLEDGEQVEMDVAGFDEDDETGEYAPTIVDLTDAQAAELYGTQGHGEDSEDGEEMGGLDQRF